MRVLTARWLLPVTAPAVRDGAVAVDDGGRIAYVGPAADAPRGERVPLGNAVLLPGLVAATAYRPGALALAAGVTTVDTAARGLQAVDALIASGGLAVLYVPFVGPTPARRDVSLAHLQTEVAELRERIATAGAAERVRIGVIPGDMPSVDEDLLLDACAWAVGQSLPIAIPAGRDAAEVAFLREGSGPIADAHRAAGLDVVRRAHSTVHLLAELGVAAVARPLLVGGALFDESDVALAAYYGCPVLYRRSLDPDVRQPLPDLIAALRAAGVAVALDAPLGIATTWGIAPDLAIELATRGIAEALGLAADTGSLAPGSRADLAAFALTAAELDVSETRGPADVLPSAATRPPTLTLVAGTPAWR